MSKKDFECLLIHTREGWGQGHSESVSVDEAGCLLLSSAENIPAEAISRPLGHRLDITGTPWLSGQKDFSLEELKNPFWVGIAFDRRNNLHLIDVKDDKDGKSCRIFRYCPQRATLEQVMYIGGQCGSQAGKFNFVSPNGDEYCGRMVFSKTTLYVTDTFNHRVQAFYLPSFQLRFILGEGQDPSLAAFESPADELSRPTDISISQKGIVYVLDTGNGRILMLNSYGGLIKTIFEGKPCGEALWKPISMALDREGCLYVLDGAKYTIGKFDKCGNRCGNISFPRCIDHHIRPTTIAVDHERILYVGGESIVANSLTSRLLRFDGATGRYLGHIEIEGDCTQLTIDRKGALYGICGQGSRVMRFGGAGHFASQGTYFSRVLDSTKEKIQWHRLLLEAEIPDKTAVNLDFYASDQSFDPEKLEASEWRSVLTSPQGGIETRDALFDNAMGRYLALKFVLSGDGNHSPKIKKVQAYFQRDSYLRYLPATYQEDPIGRDFLERFLSIFESMSLEIEETIAHVTRYLDIDATETSFLDWLSSWLAVTNDENWSEDKRRAFLKEAFELYKYRGTWRGLRRIIEIFTGGKAGIVEHFRLRPPMTLGQAAILGINTFVGPKPAKPLILGTSATIGDFVLIDAEDPPEKLLIQDAYDFTVLAETQGFDKAQESALRRLIEQEAPAHTRFFLRTTQKQGTQLGKRSLLGIDTFLTKGFSPMRLGENSRIGKTAFLGKKYLRKGILGIRSRISVDAILL
jgi:phage tail-like protein